MTKHIFLLLFLLIKTLYGHTGKNTSDVIVINSGHADAGNSDYRPKKLQPKPEVTTKNAVEVDTEPPPLSSSEFIESEKEDAVFIPNERDDRPVRPDNSYHADTLKVTDVLANRRTVNDVLIERSGPRGHRMETEPPPEVVFISGKNNERGEDTKISKARYNDNSVHLETRRSGMSNDRPKAKKIGLDCSNLDCNNTVSSVCGGKMENKKMKYRLFLNDCYFRKVNCGFRYDSSKYQVVQAVNCIKVAAHYSERPYYFKPIFRPTSSPEVAVVTNPIYRRSLHIGLNGIRCSHPCPTHCTNDYDPKCAVTPLGEKRVFINHCKIDYNSCFNGILWRVKPMSECVGWKKAEVQQNKGFINWMQRVGIVDNKESNLREVKPWNGSPDSTKWRRFSPLLTRQDKKAAVSK